MTKMHAVEEFFLQALAKNAEGCLAAIERASDINEAWVSDSDEDSYTFLHVVHAWPEKAPQFASLLLANGADPNATSLSGTTPLMYACIETKGSTADLLALVSTLLAAGANPKTCNAVRRQASHYAACQVPERSVPVTRLLKSSGASLLSVDAMGLSAIDLMSKNGVDESVLGGMLTECPQTWTLEPLACTVPQHRVRRDSASA